MMASKKKLFEDIAIISVGAFLLVTVLYLIDGLFTNAARQNNISISYSRGTITYVRKGDIYALSLATNKIKRLTKTHLRENEAILSPTGKYICFVRQIPKQKYDYNDLFIMHADGTHERLLYKGNDGAIISNFFFSSDERFVIFEQWNTVHANSVVYRLSIDTGNVNRYGSDSDEGLNTISPRVNVISNPSESIITEDKSQVIYLDVSGGGRLIKIKSRDGAYIRTLTKI